MKQLFRNILILYWQSEHKNQTIHKIEDSLVQILQYSIKLLACSNKLFNYKGHLESKERFAIKRYLLIIGKKKNMHVLSHTFTYFST